MCRWAAAICTITPCCGLKPAEGSGTVETGYAATVEEWLLAAEYLMAGGNGQVILCERESEPLRT